MIFELFYEAKPLSRAFAVLLCAGAMLRPVVIFAASTESSEGTEFFEKKVRPILVDNCYKCHSHDAEKLKGGLLLDSRDGVLKGGDSGPSIVAGQPDKSLLIKAVRYTNEDLQMPPKGKKLTSQQVADLETWVKIGAPDPRAGSQSAAQLPRAEDHWAFKPVTPPALPRVANGSWIQSPVDAFVLEKLERKKIRPNPPADKQTLILRACFDLTGMPPTSSEMETFLADNSPQAFARLVDRLLDSPQYGERWARYWLDVARYADTKGYVFEEERRYPFSFTYRDYVIRAFNEDLPYDQFIIQQIAADLLPAGEDKRALAALGFLTLGRRFLNSQPDIIDDRIDVVTRGTMGLTVACARCHDHKFDPIPTKDYYSLYGVFASCNEPSEKPLLGNSALPAAYNEYVAERKKRETELKDFRTKKQEEARTRVREQMGTYLLAARDMRGDGEKQDALARERKLDSEIVRRWARLLEKKDSPAAPILAPWLHYSAVKGTNGSEVATGISAALASNAPVNPFVLRFFSTNSPPSIKEAAERYNQLASKVVMDWNETLKKDQASSTLPDPNEEAVRQLLFGSDSPARIEEFRKVFDIPTSQKLRALQRKIDELDATHPGTPPRAMALVDNATPQKPHVFKRGNPNNPGEEVPRQFLKLIAGDKRQPFQHGSGRLELAQAIVDRNNPLTARVFVNRLWLHHFGAPLVATPSDFGLRSDPPTHPQLLDYLAARFMDDGWSIKKLHRLLMLSSTYQQSSSDNPNAEKLDPANQLLWRMNRHRLDFESMRDTLLAISGKLDLSLGGRPVDITTEPFTCRRTVYGFVERQNLPGIFRTFDFASPDSTSPQRFSTTVPQQALFLMNSPFVVQQATALLQRSELKSARSEEDRVQQLYRLVFHRRADADEMKLARSFLQLKNQSPAPELPPWEYGYGEYDEKAGKLKAFHALPTYTKYGWQGSTNLPDTKLGWVMLSAEGGHPGNDLQHAAVRRWRAPADGFISISADLDHPSDKGDGVRARIASSRKGSLGQWTVRHETKATNLPKIQVKTGDTIDFIIDCRGTVEYDSFAWAPMIRYEPEPARQAGERTLWSAKSDFGGPPREQPKSLDPWTKYAQVLLMSNELMFVD